MLKSSAFTILEIAVVMAITSLLSALFFNGLNRFSEQLRIETDLKNQMNEYMLFRSNFWRELDSQDSMEVSKTGFKLYIDTNIISYSFPENKLLRNGIALFSKNGPEFTSVQLSNETFSLNGSWKNRELKIFYPVRVENATKLNRYFHSEIWPE